MPWYLNNLCINTECLIVQGKNTAMPNPQWLNNVLIMHSSCVCKEALLCKWWQFDQHHDWISVFCSTHLFSALFWPLDSCHLTGFHISSQKSNFIKFWPYSFQRKTEPLDWKRPWYPIYKDFGQYRLFLTIFTQDEWNLTALLPHRCH